jgi:N6-adenosine-specific RNA methylase IME4
MSEPLPLPPGPFSIILADPPWAYRDRASAGRRGACYKYPTMPDAALLALPVATRAAPDAALFLWATGPRLPFALTVLAAWGFTFKTVVFVWVKTRKDGSGARLGMGNWTRSNAEVVLLGVRGHPRRLPAATAIPQLVFAPRREHSRKPDAVRERIVALLGDLPRLELFARERAAGWAAWGLEVPAACDVPDQDLGAGRTDEDAGRAAPRR